MVKLSRRIGRVMVWVVERLERGRRGKIDKAKKRGKLAPLA